MTATAAVSLPAELPAELAASQAERLQAFRQAGAGLAAAQEAELQRLWAASDLLWRICRRWPHWPRELLEADLLRRDDSLEACQQRLRAALQGVADAQDLARRLRLFRQREMLRIGWRELMGYGAFEQMLRELSWLAESCVAQAAAHLQEWLEQRHGVPRDSQGRRLDLVVLGMGKLGAHELNFSSDIDLIFCYAEEGETRGGERPLAHAAFFQRLARQLVKTLGETTAEGFVFRVDTRLRPFGASGQLVLSFDAMEQYYETHGREWERYALIKARPIAGAQHAAAGLMARLQPFVYRRYLDFGVFESLREMKRMIATEVSRKGLRDNIKLGRGGIREIEFIGQAFQLIRGGREAALRQREILAVLEALRELQLLPAHLVEPLVQAYVFLRRLENRIQLFDDRQTHELPAEAPARLRLAYAMGCAGWDELQVRLDAHRERVHEAFQQVFAAPQFDQGSADDQRKATLLALWQGRLGREQALACLRELGFADAAEALRRLELTRRSAPLRAMGPRGVERLERLMPLLLAAMGQLEAPDVCLPRVLNLLEAIARRSAYLALLAEHPLALSQLLRLFAQSPWIAEQVSRYPVLLDELLDSRRLYEPMSKAALARELNQRLQALPAGDEEAEMDLLRQFKQAHALRVAAAELSGAMAVEKVSDHLTFLAEVVLEQVLESACQRLRQRHGWPHYEVDGQLRAAAFLVVGYGKLGGFELGFGSDLDLVFLHDSQGSRQQTCGERVLDNGVFFARLAQRIIHGLTTLTASGKLYEVDTRLRPSGASGLLVSSLNSFTAYQQQQAWTWEHQALVRARPVAGSPALGDAFRAVRRQVLSRRRDPDTLRQDVWQMRRRMRASLDKSRPGRFDIKQGRGGVVDIEFLIQYLVLRWAAEHPELLEYTDNLRLLESLAKAKLLSGDDAKMLARAYLAYRHRLHELSLQQAPGVIDAEVFRACREAVSALWEAHFPDDRQSSQSV